MITLYGFARIFPEGIGETKALRAQWALDETGLPYRVHALARLDAALAGSRRRRSVRPSAPYVRRTVERLKQR